MRLRRVGDRFDFFDGVEVSAWPNVEGTLLRFDAAARCDGVSGVHHLLELTCGQINLRPVGKVCFQIDRFVSDAVLVDRRNAIKKPNGIANFVCIHLELSRRVQMFLANSGLVWQRDLIDAHHKYRRVAKVRIHHWTNGSAGHLHKLDCVANFVPNVVDIALADSIFGVDSDRGKPIDRCRLD